jgi:type IV pilus assembly protein PilB
MIDLPYIRLSETPIDDKILKTIPEVVAKKHRIISFKKDEQGLHLAMLDPTNIQIRDFIEKKVGIPVVVYYATQKDVNNALYLYRKDVKGAFEEIIAENLEKASGKSSAEPPIIKMVDTIISYAYQNKASDIHIESVNESSLVRFRIDGVLHDIIKLSGNLHPLIVTRVKVMAGLRTDEHQTAQDGKIQFKAEDEVLDIRVSIIPVTEGEKVAMRLLSERLSQFSLHELGLAGRDLAKVQEAHNKPYGMILATGPTGCGKTTTLYAVIKLLNKRNVNIMTIEDPVEYDIGGVNQVQLNPKTGLTFARGLRSIVRQDPDVIFVGEIRDEETADVAVNSAMTGHLVLSTLHTNDAATAIPRLLDMNVEPFLVASTVNVIIAQRLVRQICMRCRVGVEYSKFLIARMRPI